MTLDPEYKTFVHTLTRRVTEPHAITVSDQILHLIQEVGEASEAWELFRGMSARKEQSGSVEDVAMELADVVATVLVGISLLGLDVDACLAAQAEKTKRRFPLVWDMDAPRP